MKEIMNVNRCIILVSKICYDKIDDYGHSVNYAPFYLISHYCPRSLCKVLFTWFYISDRLFRLSGTTFVKKGMHEILNMFASLSFVNTICLWKPHTFM